ncbi:MAG: glycosyltransferase family 4 protein [Candidatus Micrarchaeota archaeon]|nr:glycosyltransferase family 4 protein [Candidatus Micrarchaeota archaeon]
MEIAKRYSCPIYAIDYKPDQTFPEFSEFDIRKIPANAIEYPPAALASLDRDVRLQWAVRAGFRILPFKIKMDYDVISAHLNPSAWIRNRNERVCWYCHGPTPSFSLYPLMWQERNLLEKALLFSAQHAFRAIDLPLMSKIEKIVTCSSWTSEKISHALGREDASVVHPAIDPRHFSCIDFKKTFIHISRIAPEKQMELTIGAFRQFSKRHWGWELVIAGFLFPNARNVDYLAKLRKLASGLNVRFEINPKDARIRELYSGCFAFLFSSFDEDWGIVILEAMASSKPVISINRGGPTISVVHGKTGFLVDSADEMAQKMRFLAEHPDICEEMGRAGRKRVEQNYTWRIFLDKMEKVFKETAKM